MHGSSQWPLSGFFPAPVGRSKARGDSFGHIHATCGHACLRAPAGGSQAARRSEQSRQHTKVPIFAHVLSEWAHALSESRALFWDLRDRLVLLAATLTEGVFFSWTGRPVQSTWRLFRPYPRELRVDAYDHQTNVAWRLRLELCDGYTRGVGRVMLFTGPVGRFQGTRGILCPIHATCGHACLCASGGSQATRCLRAHLSPEFQIVVDGVAPGCPLNSSASAWQHVSHIDYPRVLMALPPVPCPPRRAWFPRCKHSKIEIALLRSCTAICIGLQTLVVRKATYVRESKAISHCSDIRFCDAACGVWCIANPSTGKHIPTVHGATAIVGKL